MTKDEIIIEVERIAKQRLGMQPNEHFSIGQTFMLRDMFMEIMNENPQFGYRMEKRIENGKVFYRVIQLQ